MGKWMIIGVFAGLLLPFGTTLIVTGNIQGTQYSRQQERTAAGSYRIFLDQSGGSEKEKWLSLEEYLPSVLAVQVSPDSEMEAIKAQAVIARTYIRQQMENGSEKPEIGMSETGGEVTTVGKSQSVWEISESDLGLRRKPGDELKKTWGTDVFLEKYSRLEEAAAQTAGIVMTCQGKLITPLFCRLSAGKTRNGGENYSYLSSVSCPDDLEAEDFISYLSFSDAQAAEKLKAFQVRPEAIPSKVQIIKRDASAYVEEIQIDGVSLTGEEAADALGLPSACFFTEPQENGISITVKGNGHGYGLSQCEAQAKAAEGWDFKQILEYFYSDIEFCTE